LFNSCVSLGVCDTKNLIDGHPKVYSLDGSDSNYFRFQPPAFVLSHAMDEIDGNPQDKNFGFFYGATGLDGNPVF
jgi:hypothetical protein